MIFIADTVNSSSAENLGESSLKNPSKKVILRPISDPNLPFPSDPIVAANHAIVIPKLSLISEDAQQLAISSKELFDYMNKST